MGNQAIGVTLPDNTVMELDGFAGPRMWSRSQAARVLIENGLAAARESEPAQEEPGKRKKK